MKRTKFDSSVGETTHAAAEGRVRLAQAQAYLQQAQGYLAPRAQDVVKQAQEVLAQASDRLEPYALGVRRKGARIAADTVDAWQPRIDDALARVSPAVDDAYARVAPLLAGASSRIQTDVLPKISSALHEAAGDLPLAVEEVEVTKKSRWATFGKVVLASALLGGVVYAVKKFLEPSDSGWQAHEPSRPYVPNTPSTVVDDLSARTSQPEDDAAREWIQEGGTSATGGGPGASAPTVADLGVVEDDSVEVEAFDLQAETDAADTGSTQGSEGDAAPFARSPYGDGSYIGDEPGEGYTIKGNERSMKYHVEGNAGYARTIADVWFASEEAAQAAGFTKAQR